MAGAAASSVAANSSLRLVLTLPPAPVIFSRVNMCAMRVDAVVLVLLNQVLVRVGQLLMRVFEVTANVDA